MSDEEEKPHPKLPRANDQLLWVEFGDGPGGQLFLSRTLEGDHHYGWKYLRNYNQWTEKLRIHVNRIRGPVLVWEGWIGRAVETLPAEAHFDPQTRAGWALMQVAGFLLRLLALFSMVALVDILARWWFGSGLGEWFAPLRLVGFFLVGVPLVMAAMLLALAAVIIACSLLWIFLSVSLACLYVPGAEREAVRTCHLLGDLVVACGESLRSLEFSFLPLTWPPARRPRVPPVPESAKKPPPTDE